MNNNDLYLLEKKDLPEWFEYPSEFQFLVKQGSTNFGPWRLIEAKSASSIYLFLRERYGRELYPIAQKEGSDDTACLEQGAGNIIKIINGYASKGYENQEQFPSFWDWFRYAIEEMIEFND